jgi:hypothetical protein
MEVDLPRNQKYNIVLFAKIPDWYKMHADSSVPVLGGSILNVKQESR